MRGPSGVGLGVSPSFLPGADPRPLLGAVQLFQSTNLQFCICMCPDGVGAEAREQKDGGLVAVFLVCSTKPPVFIPTCCFRPGKQLQVLSLPGLLWTWVPLLRIALELGRHLRFNWLRFLKCSKNVLKFLIRPCWFSSFYVCVRTRRRAEHVDEHTCVLMCLHSYSCTLIPTHACSCVPLPMCLENKRV